MYTYILIHSCLRFLPTAQRLAYYFSFWWSLKFLLTSRSKYNVIYNSSETLFHISATVATVVALEVRQSFAQCPMLYTMGHLLRIIVTLLPIGRYLETSL